MKIVVCGSMSVAKQMVEIKEFLEKKGHEIALPRNTERYASGELAPLNNQESASAKIENDLIRKYFSAIKDSDAVLIANYDKGDIKNYVGGNSFLEAGFAHALNKKLYFINDIPDMIYSDELRVFRPVILNGDLSKV